MIYKSALASVMLVGFWGCGQASEPVAATGNSKGARSFTFNSQFDGVLYSCAGNTQAKMKNGTVDCKIGDEVTFFVGKLEIGKVKLTKEMDNKIVLQDLIGIPRDDVQDKSLSKLASFLYSLDDDSDWDINIAPGAQAAFPNAKRLSDINVDELKALLKKSGFTLREPSEFVVSDFLSSIGMKVAGKSFEELPSAIEADVKEEGKILFDGFQNTIVMESSANFDWDLGSLSMHNVKEGTYELIFKSLENKEVKPEVVRVAVGADAVSSLPVAIRPPAKVVQKPQAGAADKESISQAETLVVPLGGKKIIVKAGESIEKAIYGAKPGDEVLIHAGIYNEKIDIGGIKGTKDKWIKISNFPGEKPVIFFTGVGRGFNAEDCAYLQINGLTVKEPIGEGIRVHSSHDIIISNNEVYGLGKRGNPGGYGSHAIVVDGRKGRVSSNILVTGNYVHDNLTRYSIKREKGDDEALTIRGAVSYATAENNRVTDNQFIGIDIIGPEKENWGHSHHNVVRNNYVVGNGFKYGEEKYGDAIYVDGGSDHIIENNNVENNRGSGISAGQEHGGEILKNITIRRNVIGNQQEDQFYLGDTSNSVSNVSNILYEENYIYATKPSDDAHIGIGAGANLQLYNNHFDLVGKKIIRKVEDAGKPSMSNNKIKGNTYSSAYVQRKIEGLNWGSLQKGKVGTNARVKKLAGAIMSRIPTGDSSVVLGDREIITTRVKEAGHRLFR